MSLEHGHGHADSGSDDSVLLVRFGQRQYGLPLTSVERILPMAYVAPLPATGDGLLGMLNVHGQVLPVMDPRSRLGVPTPHVATDHRLVMLRASRLFLLWVDEVHDVVHASADEMSAVPAQQASPVVPRVLRLGETIVPILAPTALEPRGSLR